MNRLILIGNGFDLAHKLPTSYNDFMLWLLKNSYTEAAEKDSFRHNLIQIQTVYNYKSIFGGYPVDSVVDYFYKVGFHDLFDRDQITIPDKGLVMNPFKTEIDQFLRRLLNNCTGTNWVVIENEFYQALRSILKNTMWDKERKKRECITLNNSMESLIKVFKIYLSTLRLPAPSSESYRKIFEAPFQEREFKNSDDVHFSSDPAPEHIYILNFNYTNTASWYGTTIKQSVNNIHGSIDDSQNPMIFGFGDELDDDYIEIEKSGINDFFTYIKSFWYLRAENYYQMLRFVESGYFQIYIMGHSCGLSDRTMLSMLFKHNNCRSIKIFYHETERGVNNFTDLTMEISRHFTKKEMLREKLVNMEFCEKMPQLRM